ncbi:MAG: hypothetical protein C4B58_00270 [Deltaproteobacteria bacterium]|uniref:Uncharacterized protein n=1 Tax=Candidatus Methanogaster sp. TaxID=3386292 RepID=A0AC61L0Q5_9EURY|nr:MAG: hypothetical protein C4B59_11575 [ANME-2 cluster archaeon]PXF60311.1 MAG: hypothetical protein C4B58_00270 [Deltaproteobacteria bacterium]
MADFYINVLMDDEKLKKIEAAGLADQVQEIDGKKVIQVGMNKKDKKKLCKGFTDLAFDSSDACVLPEDAENTLMGIIGDMGTLDVMKVAITKLYNPLAGKSIRTTM